MTLGVKRYGSLIFNGFKIRLRYETYIVPRCSLIYRYSCAEAWL